MGNYVNRQLILFSVIWHETVSHLPHGDPHPKQIVGLSLSSDKSKLYSLGGEVLKRLDIASETFE